MTEKTDKQLLQLAAKAAGLEIKEWVRYRKGVEVAVLIDGSYWNPLHINQLTDSMGDAMRLAVKLFMAVLVYDNATGILLSGKFSYHERPAHQDHDEAARRAIVIDAATIGEAMP